MRTRLIAPSAALFTLCLTAAPHAARADSSIFVLDFNDGTATPDYSFELNYTSQTLTVQDEIDQFAAKITSPAFTDAYQQYSFGRFYTQFGYAGKSATNAGDFSSYWGLWTSSDGINWTSAQVGASGLALSNGSYASFSFGPNGGPAPVTPPKLSAIVSAAAAPEAGSLALILVGGLASIAGMPRRWRAARPCVRDSSGEAASAIK